MKNAMKMQILKRLESVFVHGCKHWCFLSLATFPCTQTGWCQSRCGVNSHPSKITFQLAFTYSFWYSMFSLLLSSPSIFVGGPQLYESDENSLIDKSSQDTNTRMPLWISVKGTHLWICDNITNVNYSITLEHFRASRLYSSQAQFGLSASVFDMSVR